MATHLLEGTQLNHGYKILDIIGQGGFGITYLGMNPSGERVAIKELFIREIMERDSETDCLVLTKKEDLSAYEKYKEDMRQEAEILTQYSNFDHIVHVIESFEENNTLYMVMPYIPGIDLKKHIMDYGTFSAEEAFEKMLPLMDDLHRIHEKKQIHRDISPDNIRLTPDGQLVLTDFGAARSYEGNRTLSRVLKEGYAPVEQAAGNADQGPWTDVYALSATIYEMITGQRPQHSVSRMLYDELKLPSKMGYSLDSEVEAILKKGLEVQAEDRYQSLQDMARDYRTITSRKESKKRRIKIGSLLTVFLLISMTLSYKIWKEYRGYPYDPVRDYKILITYPEGDDKEKEEWKETLLHRLEVFAGSENSGWEDASEGVCLFISREMYHNLPYIPYTKELLTRPSELYLVDTSQYDASTKAYLRKIHRDDIAKIEKMHGNVSEANASDYNIHQTEYSYIHIELKDYVMAELDKEGWKGPYIFCQDAEQKGADHIYYDAFMDELNGFNILVDTASDNMIDTMINNWSLPASGKALYVQDDYEQQASWQDPDHPEGTNTIGQSQVSAKRIDTDGLVLAFKPFDQLMTSGDWMDTEAIFKKRLDGMGEPYAYGTFEEYGVRYIAIKISSRKMGIPVISMLTSTSYGTLYGEMATFSLPFDTTDAEIYERNGQYGIRFKLGEKNRKGLENFTRYLVENDIQEMQLNLSTCRILTKMTPEIITDGVLEMDHLADPQGSPITEENLFILRLMKTLSDAKSYKDSPSVMHYVGCTAEDDSISFGIADFDSLYYSDMEKKIKAIDSRIQLYRYQSQLQVDLNLPVNDELPSRIAEDFEQIMRIVNFTHTDLYRITINPVKVEPGETASILLWKNRISIEDIKEDESQNTAAEKRITDSVKGQVKFGGNMELSGGRLTPYNEEFQKRLQESYQKIVEVY